MYKKASSKWAFEYFVLSKSERQKRFRVRAFGEEMREIKVKIKSFLTLLYLTSFASDDAVMNAGRRIVTNFTEKKTDKFCFVWKRFVERTIFRKETKKIFSRVVFSPKCSRLKSIDRLNFFEFQTIVLTKDFDRKSKVPSHSQWIWKRNEKMTNVFCENFDFRFVEHRSNILIF